MTSSNTGRPSPKLIDHMPVEELARRQGIHPIASADELTQPGTFESDEELDEFLTNLHQTRQADIA